METTPRRFSGPPERILLASTGGRPIPTDVIRRTVALATPAHAKITVLGVARVFGTSLGLPHPGLQPTEGEWEAERTSVHDAADDIRSRGFEVRVALSKSRNVPKMIARWGKAKNFHAIVVPDPARNRWRRMLEGDLAHEIERRCGIPVHTVST